VTLIEFKDWALAQSSVGNPGTGSYLGQCVSLVQQYLDRCFGIPYQPRGNAKDWPTNANVLSYFDVVSDVREGDIGVMGANYGNGNGHIFVYLPGGFILEQNRRVPLRVSTGSPYPSPMAILRRKGGSMTDAEQLAVAREQAIQSTQEAVYIPKHETNSTEDINKRVRLVNGDVDNLFKDLGIAPTQSDYAALGNGPKDFLYYFQTQVKARYHPEFEPVSEQLYNKKGV
jgi:hypothetical protein